VAGEPGGDGRAGELPHKRSVWTSGCYHDRYSTRPAGANGGEAVSGEPASDARRGE
jgi:hypothetical protein